MKKLWKFLGSMRFAILLLVVLILACAGGSFITQGLSYEEYAQRYSQRAAGLILALGLDDLFHSWWFLLITAFLCGNLLLCNLIRLPQLLRRTRDAADPAKAIGSPAIVTVEGVEDPERVFAALGMPKARTARDPEGRTLRFSLRHRAGLWGAWVCHLGILLLILGFALGQMTKEEYVVYGVPGQSKQVGDTDLILSIDDFRVELREDDTVEQYTADITLRNAADGSSRSAQIRVNEPASLYGMKFYQNSTGWAAKVTVTEGGAPLQEAVLCAGESLAVQDKPELVIWFRAFYPDYVMIEGQGPATATGSLRNPGYLYMVSYRDSVLGMNVLEEGDRVTIDDYEVVFSEPRNYTLIQAKRDRFTPLALLGGLVTLLGLILAFYLQTRRVWAVEEAPGRWTLYGHSPKGGALFAERLREAAEQSSAPS